MEVDEQSLSQSRTKKSKKRSIEEGLNEALESVKHNPGTKHENLQVKIQLFQEQSNKIPPLLAYFPSGYNPCKTQQEEGGANEPKVKVFRNMAQRKSNRLQVVVSPSGSNVDFVGSSYTGEAAAAQVCRYSLGVLDKEAGTLKIIPIATNKIFRLEPRVRTSETSNEDASMSAKSELTTDKKDMLDKLGELTALYGTKRDRKKRKDFIDLKKEADPESQKALEKKIGEVAFDKDALANTSAVIARNIPPHDVSATTPPKAYPLDKIILKGDWDFLGDIYKLVEAGEKVANTAYPHFVCNRIRKLDATQDETQKWQLSCVFSYITHLVKFRDQFSMGQTASAKNHNIPSIIRHRFMNMFTDPGSKILASEKIDLLISYVLVLTLHVDGFRTDPSDIANDLRISKVDLRRHFLNLGCKLVHQSSVLYATLPVPLNFPSENLRKKRRQ
ncbi:ADP-ribosylation factor GTPase-activating protein AGD8 [Hibiscus syriacus]|uniref:ADP-ribosylation factor GTPase-activating protein AGD8 n=1 Tax=Hibiscus syriacus TaxID=106335 RepID=A0A6A3C4Q3_HIBSY|nr:DNA-directed RNA polymerase I subunit rpa49-like [Hibiscus syriacus]KAE8724160.1 ADP-ribosylation factor GTPase-activating protein AGD8 [Hibiscus syriacus]